MQASPGCHDSQRVESAGPGGIRCVGLDAWYSHRLSRRHFGILVAALLAGTRVRAADLPPLPDLGDSASAVLSPAEDRKLGEAFMREVRAQADVMDDPEINAYIQSLGHRLASQSDVDTGGFEYFVIRDPTINAFAGPGGHVGMYTGLIQLSESEKELAAVLGHETGHILQHHIARRIEEARGLQVPVLAGLAAAVLLGIRSPDLGVAAMSAVQGGAAQAQLAFSRSMEEEADNTGMHLLYAAGFDPHAMPDFFERLQRASRYWSQPPAFLQTHPVTIERIAYSRARAEQYPPPTAPYRDGSTYPLLKARVGILVEPDHAKAVADTRARLASGQYADQAATKYGLALALERTDHYDEARSILRTLVAEHPDNSWYASALAQVELNAGNLRQAEKIYAAGLQIDPDNQAFLRGYVRTLLRARQAPKAVVVLEDFERRNAMSAPLYRLLAEAYKDAGRHPDSLFALSQYYYREGNLDLAIFELERVEHSSTAGFYQTSRARARLQELHLERKERSAPG
jgi:predicted Zn-dependent protease